MQLLSGATSGDSSSIYKSQNMAKDADATRQGSMQDLTNMIQGQDRTLGFNQQAGGGMANMINQGEGASVQLGSPNYMSNGRLDLKKLFKSSSGVTSPTGDTSWSSDF